MCDLVYITTFVILIVIVICTAIYCKDLKERIDFFEFAFFHGNKKTPNEAGTSVERMENDLY